MLENIKVQINNMVYVMIFFFNPFDIIGCPFSIGNILQDKFLMGPTFENYKVLSQLCCFQYICKYESNTLRCLEVTIFKEPACIICPYNEWNCKTIIKFQQMLLFQHLFP